MINAQKQNIVYSHTHTHMQKYVAIMMIKYYSLYMHYLIGHVRLYGLMVCISILVKIYNLYARVTYVLCTERKKVREREKMTKTIAVLLCKAIYLASMYVCFMHRCV